MLCPAMPNREPFGYKKARTGFVGKLVVARNFYVGRIGQHFVNDREQGAWGAGAQGACVNDSKAGRIAYLLTTHIGRNNLNSLWLEE